MLVGAYYSEGSGGSGARFWTIAVLRGRVVTFGREGRDTVAGAYSRGLPRFCVGGSSLLASQI